MSASVDPQHPSTVPPMQREDLCEYVAQLQLHMTLQARNLVPGLAQASDSRTQFLHQTQALFERQVSRQR